MAFFKSLLKTLNRLRSGLREKPEVTLDAYILEHFLMYHGLVGSMPENQPDFKDVRADVVEAVNHASSAEMAIALKLPPLWWEDRLYKIFEEVVALNHEGALRCLLPESLAEDLNPDNFPLTHSDWRVRANAARMLSKLGLTIAVRYITPALDDKAPDQGPAFCHLAYSLARLQNDEARQALVKHLHNDEPWFRVDAAGALAHWPLHAVAHDLMRSLVDDHNLLDYAAVAVARKHAPAMFFEMQDDDVIEGAAEMVCALLKGLNGPFHAESGLAEQLEDCAEQLNIAAGVKPTPRRLNAAISLNRWLHGRSAKTRAGSLTSNVYTLMDITTELHRNCILDVLRSPGKNAEQRSDLRHAIELCGECRITEAIPLLLALLKEEMPLLPAIVQSLGKLAAAEAAPTIIALVERNMEFHERWHSPPSKNPVVEQNEEGALLYWTALQALAAMPCKESLAFLSSAVNDFAPDKREQALLALERVSRTMGDAGEPMSASQLTEIIRDRLTDPSPQVRAAALKAVGAHHNMDLLPDSMRLIHSPEVSLQRQCIETLSELARSGHRDEVVTATKSALSRELDGARRERLNRLLRALQPS